jgi:hypothetical protein
MVLISVGVRCVGCFSSEIGARSMSALFGSVTPHMTQHSIVSGSEVLAFVHLRSKGPVGVMLLDGSVGGGNLMKAPATKFPHETCFRNWRKSEER